MNRERLDLESFEQLLDEHGADLERWPEALQVSARALLESSTDAQQARSRAERLATLLDALPDVLPSAELSARIAALPVRHEQGWAAWWPFGNPFAPLLAWGAAAAFGVFIGSGLLPGLDLSIEGESGASVHAEWTAAAGDAPSDSAAQRESVDSADRDSADRDSADRDSADRDSASTGADEAQADDWSELELALGLGPEWEDEP